MTSTGHPRGENVNTKEKKEQNKEPEINLHEYSQLIFDKETKEQRQYNGAKIVYSTNDPGKTEHAHSKINSKWIIHLNIKYKTPRR